MTQHEFEYWKEVMQNSRFRWVEDDITRLNGNGVLYYTGGEDGIYMRLSPDGLLTAGTYEEAFPHIGEAIFQPKTERRYDSFDKALEAAMGLGGKQFLVDLLTGSDTERTLAEPDEPKSCSFELKM